VDLVGWLHRGCLGGLPAHIPGWQQAANVPLSVACSACKVKLCRRCHEKHVCDNKSESGPTFV